jgi:hypothetical protein
MSAYSDTVSCFLHVSCLHVEVDHTDFLVTNVTTVSLWCICAGQTAYYVGITTVNTTAFRIPHDSPPELSGVAR